MIYAHHGQKIDFNVVDLALLFSDTKPSGLGLRSERFLSGSSIPVCSPGSLARSPQSLTPEQFMALGLLHDTDFASWRVWFERACVPVPDAMPGPVFEDFNLLRAAALAGQGVALCPLAMIQPDLIAGRLVQLSDISVLEQFDYYLIQPDRHPDYEICAGTRDVFVRWLKEEKRLPLD